MRLKKLKRKKRNFETKNELEKKIQELIREHKFLKDKINTCKLEAKKRLDLEDHFNQEIEELSQETENLSI